MIEIGIYLFENIMYFLLRKYYSFLDVFFISYMRQIVEFIIFIAIYTAELVQSSFTRNIVKKNARGLYVKW